MKKIFILGITGAMCAATILTGCGSDATQAASKETTALDETTAQKTISYTKLQQLFQEINFKTTSQEVEDLISKYDLQCTKEKYNRSPEYEVYKIAYTEEVAAQSYAEEGENIEVAISGVGYDFMYATYENHDKMKSALIYNFGNYFSFTEKYPSSEYSGYYYYTPGTDSGGITITYSNGNTRETGYHKCNSAQEAIDNTEI